MAGESAGATLVVMTDDLDHGHRATSRLYRGRWRAHSGAERAWTARSSLFLVLETVAVGA
jgi:hypothetical protein